MPNAKLTSYLHLHFIVFIWGFTAILGELITITAVPLVGYRMSMATLFIGIYIWYKKISVRISLQNGIKACLGGILIALHWITFFYAIKVSNVSITLAVLSSGAFFTALLEPLFYRRRLIGYEVLFGLLIILGIYIVFSAEKEQGEGIIFALISAILSSLFALLNGKLAKKMRSSVISLYELGFGAIIITLLLAINFKFPFLNMGSYAEVLPRRLDWAYLFLLSSICTAYAFIVAVKVMKHISPFTVMLTTNLEPVYGIILALLIFGESEKMTASFYYGALLILSTVVINGIVKNRKN